MYRAKIFGLVNPNRSRHRLGALYASPMDNSVVATPVAPVVEDASAPAIAETDRQGLATIEAELLIEEISIDGMCGVY